MSSEVLYVRGMNVSESDDDNIWDDRKLNDAYDKALRMANDDVAKRIAMSTNTGSKYTEKQSSSKKSQSTSSKSKSSKIQWKAGMQCKAVYKDDGLVYKAVVLSIIDDKDCIVQFSDYDNLQKMPISELQLPLDKSEQAVRIAETLFDRHDDGFESQTVEDMEHEEGTSTGDLGVSQQQKRNRKGKSKQKRSSFTLSDMPMPDISILKNDQALSSMLLGWYMSGYYTGLYQGMKRKTGTTNEGSFFYIILTIT
ncbi:unnamed protein product [Leptidea sinapis]|uniref:Tudor domain-containing protein n=1 Tax=Leptidea sinapis TaxID=189913 RepID=A0A5E4QK73_9NEOP|nr:unnamed protein product [Leptidea sinapis]